MKNLILAASFIFALAAAQDALALAEFKKAFAERYSDNADKYVSGDKVVVFQAAVKKASCNVCHVKGAKKDYRNEYGEALAKLIEGDANARKKAAKAEGGNEAKDAEEEKIMQELLVAFEKVEKMKSHTGKTYAEVMKVGELPVDMDYAAEVYKKKKAEEEK